MTQTGLVLSGGGMFGAYQAGVWDVLENEFKPDVVVGASVGSLNGWLIAGGIPAREISAGWSALQEIGLLTRAKAEQWIRATHERTKPRIAFGLVTTELPSCKPRLFRAPQIDWQHLASSCALPLYLRQYKLEGRWQADGGLQDPLPAWGAVEMGATRLVTINLLPYRPWFVRLPSWTLARISRHETALASNIDVVAIEPSRRLGTILDSCRWTDSSARRMLELGREDALRAVPAVRKLQQP